MESNRNLNANLEGKEEGGNDATADNGCGDMPTVISETTAAASPGPASDLKGVKRLTPLKEKCQVTPFIQRSWSSLPISTSSLQARILSVILMQGIAVIALICQAHIFYRDLKWNWILDGESAINFQTTNLSFTRRYLDFGGEREPLRKLLRRNVILPAICMILVGSLILVNIISQSFDLKVRHRFLSCSAGVYAFLGASLLTIAAIQLALTQEYVRNSYGTVLKTLANDISWDEDTQPEELPKGDPISVKSGAQYFLQVFESCKNGDTQEWNRKSDLMGVRNKLFKIPSYRQLVQIGFCIDKKTIIAPIIIMTLLTFLSWLNVFLCLQIWRRHSLAYLTDCDKEEKLRCGRGYTDLRREMESFRDN